MYDRMGAQHEQLVANPILWLKGFADEKQAPRQPKVGILKLHSCLCMSRYPFDTVHCTLQYGGLFLDLAVIVVSNNMPMTIFEMEGIIFTSLYKETKQL